MKNLLSFLSIIILIFISSCGEEASEELIDNIDKETVVDDATSEETAADTSSTGVYQEEVDETEETSLQDAMKNNNAEPEAEEGAMSFCDCVKENKRLDDIMMADETSDADFDKAMADKEALKTGDCKILFATSQNTLEDKKAHERKVKRCLSK